MFLENKLSSKKVPAELLQPDEHDPFYVKDYERGGLTLRETSAGINRKQWEFFIENGTSIYCRVIDTEKKYLLISNVNITEVVGTFDRNMNVCVVFRSNQKYYFYWFDTVSNSYLTEELPNVVSSPRLCHDDKRDEATEYSDVILTYIKTDKLIYRLQRDRFTVDYIAATRGVKDREIIRFGMNKSLRLQWTLDQSSKYRE